MGLEIFPAHVPKTPVRKCWACLLVMDERLDAAAAAARSRARFFVKGDQSGVDALFFFFFLSPPLGVIAARMPDNGRQGFEIDSCWPTATRRARGRRRSGWLEPAYTRLFLSLSRNARVDHIQCSLRAERDCRLAISFLLSGETPCREALGTHLSSSFLHTGWHGRSTITVGMMQPLPQPPYPAEVSSLQIRRQ